MSDDALAQAEDRAEALLTELDIELPEHIDVALIAAHLGVFVRAAPLRDEEANLVRSPGLGLVTLADRVRGSHKQSFVLAHEVGHFVLHRDLDDARRCAPLRTFGKAGAQSREVEAREAEASAFASALVLPRAMIARACATEQPDLALLSALADRHRVSLSVAALRFVALTPAACAVVWSERACVVWRRRSTAFSFDVRVGHSIGGAAYARLCAAGESAPRGLLPVDPRAWGGPSSAEAELFEESRGGRSGTLTWLWHP